MGCVDTPEVFRTGGYLIFEMKDEYAWVLLLKEEGRYLVSLKRLDLVFPEWKMVKALHKAGEKPGTKECRPGAARQRDTQKGTHN